MQQNVPEVIFICTLSKQHLVENEVKLKLNHNFIQFFNFCPQGACFDLFAADFWNIVAESCL